MARILIRTATYQFINNSIKITIDNEPYNVFTVAGPTMDLIHTWDSSEHNRRSMSSGSSLSVSKPRASMDRGRSTPAQENSPKAVSSAATSSLIQIMDDDVANVIIDDVECRNLEGLAFTG